MPPKPESLPIDDALPLSPTKAIWIQHHKSTTIISDLTKNLAEIYTDSKVSLSNAHAFSTSTPNPPVIYTLEKLNPLGTKGTVNDGTGKRVAEWTSPIFSSKMGSTTIEFMDGDEGVLNEHCGHTIVVSPTGIGRRAESFTKDSIPYHWEVEPHHHEVKKLYKVMATSDEANPKKKVEVARFLTKQSNIKNGVLVLDIREADDLVTVLTLCALLETKDSFAKKGTEKTAVGLVVAGACLLM